MRAIDADKLLRDIEKYHVSDGKFQHWVQIQPTIEPERKKGEWIDDNCSECGCYVYHGDMRNFCPKCGAKMNGGETS